MSSLTKEWNVKADVLKTQIVESSACTSDMSKIQAEIQNWVVCDCISECLHRPFIDGNGDDDDNDDNDEAVTTVLLLPSSLHDHHIFRLSLHVLSMTVLMGCKHLPFVVP